jgi:hypothetical protein
MHPTNPTTKGTHDMSTRITKLTASNVSALGEVFGEDALVTTATTAEWPGLEPEAVLAALDARMAELPTKGHPRASLHAVRRKLAEAQPVQVKPKAPEPEFTPDVEFEPGTPVEIVEEAKLQQEIVFLTQRQRHVDDQMFEQQGVYEKAQSKADASSKLADVEAANAAHEKLLKLIAAGTTVSEKLQILRQPAELERRVNQSTIQTERTATKVAATKTKTSKETAQDQGFPKAYLGSNGNFKPGLDARAKSDLINAVLGIDGGSALHKFSAEKAQELIDVRGWGDFLDRKREIVEAKAEAKEKAAKEKAAAATAKAEAKKAKADEPEVDEVKPDPKPKPTGRKRSSARSARGGARAKAAK